MSKIGLFVEIDDDLKDRFRIKCIKKAVSQTEQINHWIRLWVKQGGRNAKKKTKKVKSG